MLTIFLLGTAVLSSCRKDEDLNAFVDKKTDSTAISSSIGSFLATEGKLKVVLEDSTYTFDAAVDSIAFIKVDTAGSEYFGITAINKAHTVSFGISGAGAAVNKTKATVAGGQLLFKLDSQAVAYTLSRQAHKLDLGKLNLKKYKEEEEKGIEAKGSFTTFLEKGAIKDSVMYKVTGSFDLKF
ncbi:hypothetical protein EOD41_15190 [Mucilaginibacter limnophilus]|uniref:Uncharacterized protein n=1 Tax=Mucilaginibacter limnophilus TaxID=1932778 RepID=A0A437MQA1_9SPHI|nr:hypothetical protein [Mucilaginibacter limnophilus]RVT99785.1 hypothetical protein EOD41_15190 [Mucilaginibacter limnophilus]